MEQIFRWGVQQVSRIHNLILRLNDHFDTSFTDKELHLLVMGVMGMAIFFLTYLLFKMIERRFVHSTMIFSFIFSLTNLVVIAFAIEIGQRISHTGNMEFLDIVYGLWGFIIMFTGYIIILATVNLISNQLRKRRAKR